MLVRPSKIAVILMMALALAACQPEAGDHPPAPLETWLPLTVGGVTVQAQIAILPQEQSRGLMHRESLPADGGMLFPYPTARRMSFWMANTRIPLDIGFFDSNGILLEIRRMVPFDTTPVQSLSDQVQFALEVNSGWFSRQGLAPGAQLDLDLLRAALIRRGAEPRQFGL